MRSPMCVALRVLMGPCFGSVYSWVRALGSCVGFVRCTPYTHGSIRALGPCVVCGGTGDDSDDVGKLIDLLSPAYLLTC